MKKSLSLLLAIAMVFSMFASVASADSTMSAQEQYDALKAKGIFTGYPDGTAGLDKEMTRAQFAVVVAKLFNLDTTSAPSTATFTDVPTSHWAFASVEAAVKAGLLSGYGNGMYGDKDNVTVEQMARVLVDALGIQVDENATVDGKTSSWATKYVAAAIKAGLIPAASDYTMNATRAQLVSSSFVADEQVTAKNAAVEISLAATGVKELTVSFNKAVDSSKASFKVNKGLININVSEVAFASDNKSAVLSLSSKLTDGDYTVTVSGVSEAALSATVTAQDEKTASIELLSDTASATLDTYGSVTGATVSYKVFNQYGEDITDTAPAIIWTPSVGTADDDNSGKITFTNAFKIGDTVTITGVISQDGIVVSKVLKIGNAASVSSVVVKELYNEDGDQLATNSDFTTFVLLIEAKDQYGNAVNAAKFNSDVIVTSSNTSILNVGTAADDQGSDSDQLGIPLADPTGTGVDGTAVINIITKAGGQVFSYNVSVAKATEVDQITLSNPAEVVAVNDTVEIPFVAVDQNGKAVTKKSILDSDVTRSATSGTLAFATDYVANKAVLNYTAPATEGSYVLMAVSKTGKVSQITVQVKEAREPATVTKSADLVSTYNVDGTATIDTDSVTVYDQYGKEVDLDSTFFTNYKLVVKASDGNADKVTVGGGASAEIASTNDSVELKGLAKGTEKIQISIYTTANALVDGSEYEFSAKTVETSSIDSYAFTSVTSAVYDDGAATTHNADLDIVGMMGTTKVALPTSMFSVTTNNSAVTYDAANRQIAVNGVSFGDDTEKTVTVIGVVNANGGAVTLTKDITVSNAAPKVATISNDSTATLDYSDGVVSGTATNITVANVLATFTAEDQYGVDINIVNPYVTITNISDYSDDSTPPTVTANGTTTAAITIGTVAAGDTFNLTIVTSNGKVATVKVVAE